MNKETIITDAIDYIEELQISVESLTNKIHEMEAEMANEQSFEIIQIRPEEKMKKYGKEVSFQNKIITSYQIIFIIQRYFLHFDKHS